MKIEIRGKDAVISGYVNVCERLSKPLYSSGKRFLEKIEQGVFERALKNAEREERSIPLLKDHIRGREYADTRDGSLELKEDNIGLFARAYTSDEEFIKEARRAKGWSFAFTDSKESFKEEEGVEVRSIEDLKLLEVSLIIDKSPCYSATSVEMRAEEEIRTEERGYPDIPEITENTREKVKVGEVYRKKVEILKNL